MVSFSSLNSPATQGTWRKSTFPLLALFLLLSSSQTEPFIYVYMFYKGKIVSVHGLGSYGFSKARILLF